MNRTMDLQQLWRLEKSKRESDLTSVLTELTKLIGFDHFLYCASFSSSGGQRIEKRMSNHPLAAKTDGGTDLWTQHGRFNHYAHHNIVPLLWQCRDAEKSERRAFYRNAHVHRMTAGVCCPVHRRDGPVGTLSFSLHADSKEAGDFIGSRRSDALLIAAITHEVMHRLAHGQQREIKTRLTARELECLKWIAAGKSTWETATILKLSEHGVNFHVRNIKRKFNVSSRFQAVAMAIAKGFI
jgi:LuxR family quorum-sensing transcriptional regulator LasR